MAKRSTFIKLNRNISNWRWYKNANTMRVFIDLLLEANVTTHYFEGVLIKRGEVVTSYEKLSKKLDISQQSVRTAIKHLKSTEEITSKIYPKFQVISIKNYDYYQSANRKSNSQLTTI